MKEVKSGMISFLLLSMALHFLVVSFFLALPKAKGHEERRFFALLVEEPRLPALQPRPAVKEAPAPVEKALPRQPAYARKKVFEEAGPSLKNETEGEGKGAQTEMAEGAPEVGRMGGQSTKRTEGARESLRERLFDKEAINEVLAKRQGAPPQKSPITFDTKEMMYYGYMQRLRESIEGVWAYPPEAAQKGIYGDLLIEFVIKKDGSLGSVKVLRTSGHPLLDEAALKALRKAEPYWPLPESWGMGALSVKGHFIYTLYGEYYVK